VASRKDLSCPPLTTGHWPLTTVLTYVINDAMIPAVRFSSRPLEAEQWTEHPKVGQKAIVQGIILNGDSNLRSA
jgi:hypothetical protein